MLITALDYFRNDKVSYIFSNKTCTEKDGGLCVPFPVI